MQHMMDARGLDTSAAHGATFMASHSGSPYMALDTPPAAISATSSSGSLTRVLVAQSANGRKKRRMQADDTFFCPLGC